jgi:hypothetical protein
MKAFLWVVLLGFLGVCFYFIFMAMVPAESRSIAMAFGHSTEDSVEMHVELSMLMAGADTFGYADAAGNMDWPAWALAHYIVVDAAGNQVAFTKQMNSSLVSDRDTRGYHDSFLIGKLKPGVAYTFTYIPVIGEPEAYYHEFTAPTDDAGRTRESFQAK